MTRSRQEILAQIADQRRRQNVSLLRIYNYYRIVLGVSLLVFFIREIGERQLGTLAPEYFVFTTAAYIVGNALFAGASLLLPVRMLDRQLFGFFVVVADSLALALLMHFSEGVSSGLGALMIVSIAAGSILVRRREYPAHWPQSSALASPGPRRWSRPTDRWPRASWDRSAVQLRPARG